MNGTEEFADDPYALTHQGVSYHWAPYWQECPVCSSITRPDYIIHMETLSKDLATVLEDTQLSQHMDLFPHTHSQTGGTLLIPIQQLPVSAVKQAAVTAV